jgi:TolB-like protein/DNA-binding SARP family transcriptional activator
MFLLRLFGGASLEAASGPLTGRATQRRRMALLAILALEHRRAVARDRLVAWLWPEHDAERARHLLRDSVYILRGALGEDSLLNAGDELRLNPERLRCDVWEFSEALANHQPKVAITAYTGPLLDGFHAGGAPELDHWLDANQERLARAYADALERLADEASARGDLKGAADYWQRLVTTNPYNSRATLRLMEALDAMGDRAGALRHGRIHAARLEQEFGAKADPEFVALEERLRVSPTLPAASAGTIAPAAGPGATAPPPAVHEFTGGDERITAAVWTSSDSHRSRALRGRRQLAVVAAPLIVATVLALTWLLPESRARTGVSLAAASMRPRTVAVLPCTNWSKDPAEQYFSDGLTEELTGALAKVRALRVAARTSTFAVKKGDRDVRQVGRALGVSAVLECSVRRAGDRVRVTAELINTADGFHQWAESYERDGTDIFAIQSELALRIAAGLSAELTPRERDRLARRPTASPAAHDLYLKGRYFWNQRSAAGFERAIEYYRRAIASDSEYAEAYAGLAAAYSMQPFVGELTPAEALEQTRVNALKALELDADLAEAHTVLAGYYHAHVWNSEAAEREHLRALELDPNYSIGHLWYANFLVSMRRFDEAIAHRRKALELDPLSPQMNLMLGSTLLAAGQHRDALAHLRDAVELDSMYWLGQATLGEYYEATGHMAEAIRFHRRAVGLTPRNPSAKAGLARALAVAGRKEEARAILHDLETEAHRNAIYAPPVATVLDALNDRTGALAWLERSYEQRHPALRFMDGPRFARLAADPLFRDLRRRVGLPP